MLGMTIEQFVYEYLLEHASDYRWDPNRAWEKRAHLASDGVGKRSYGGGNAMSKSWMASSLLSPRQLINLVPIDRKVCHAVAKPNDLKPRALYPVEHWTTILDCIVIGELEEMLYDEKCPITTPE